MQEIWIEPGKMLTIGGMTFKILRVVHGRVRLRVVHPFEEEIRRVRAPLAAPIEPEPKRKVPRPLHGGRLVAGVLVGDFSE